MSVSYSIADLAREFSVTPRTLRYYEDQGLLSPDRKGQNRFYSGTDRVRLAWILRGKRVGFSIAEIQEMLSLYDVGDNRITQRKVTLDKCRKRLTALETQREDLNATIDELSNFCSLLETMEQDPTSGRWTDPRTGRPPSKLSMESI